jgi:hypothetical protein
MGEGGETKPRVKRKKGFWKEKREIELVFESRNVKIEIVNIV